jgi:hypothetical protein
MLSSFLSFFSSSNILAARPYYQTASQRRGSIYTSETGDLYFPSKEGVHGVSAEVRCLNSENKDAIPLVVKSPLLGFSKTALADEVHYLKSAYPDHSNNIWPFKCNDQVLKLL